MANTTGIWTLKKLRRQMLDSLWTNYVNSHSLWSWGSNVFGALGQDNTNDLSSPVQVGTDINWDKVVFSSINSVLAIKTDGTLWAWGKNDSGQLGLGDAGSGTNRSSPTQVGALTNWSNVSAGSEAIDSSILAIKTDGTLWAWGNNAYGQLGLGDAGYYTYRSSPTQVGALTTWSNSISINGAASGAIKTDGTLWTWGKNYSGQLGHNNQTTYSSPVQIGALTTWANISSGENHMMAIKIDGTMWAWGNNAYGQLGLGNVIYRSSPVQIGALTTWASGSASFNFSLAIKTDGTLWSWGINIHGQLGLGDVAYRSSPVQVGTKTTWSSVLTGDGYTIATETDNTRWAWGLNNHGQLGQGDSVARSSPVQITTLVGLFFVPGATMPI